MAAKKGGGYYWFRIWLVVLGIVFIGVFCFALYMANRDALGRLAVSWGLAAETKQSARQPVTEPPAVKAEKPKPISEMIRERETEMKQSGALAKRMKEKRDEIEKSRKKLFYEKKDFRSEVESLIAERIQGDKAVSIVKNERLEQLLKLIAQREAYITEFDMLIEMYERGLGELDFSANKLSADLDLLRSYKFEGDFPKGKEFQSALDHLRERVNNYEAFMTKPPVDLKTGPPRDHDAILKEIVDEMRREKAIKDLREREAEERKKTEEAARRKAEQEALERARREEQEAQRRVQAEAAARQRAEQEARAREEREQKARESKRQADHQARLKAELAKRRIDVRWYAPQDQQTDGRFSIVSIGISELFTVVELDILSHPEGWHYDGAKIALVAPSRWDRAENIFDQTKNNFIFDRVEYEKNKGLYPRLRSGRYFLIFERRDEKRLYAASIRLDDKPYPQVAETVVSYNGLREVEKDDWVFVRLAEAGKEIKAAIFRKAEALRGLEKLTGLTPEPIEQAAGQPHRTEFDRLMREGKFSFKHFSSLESGRYVADLQTDLHAGAINTIVSTESALVFEIFSPNANCCATYHQTDWYLIDARGRRHEARRRLQYPLAAHYTVDRKTKENGKFKPAEYFAYYFIFDPIDVTAIKTGSLYLRITSTQELSLMAKFGALREIRPDESFSYVWSDGWQLRSSVKQRPRSDWEIEIVVGN